MMIEQPTEADAASANIPSLINAAVARATEVIDRLARQVREPPTREGAASWLAVPPSDWPDTPPLEVWAVLDAVDPALRYEMPEGMLRNLLDEAVEILTDLRVLQVPDWAVGPVDTGQPPTGTGTMAEE